MLIPNSITGPCAKCQMFLQKLRQQLHQDPVWLLKRGLAYIRWISSHLVTTLHASPVDRGSYEERKTCF